MKIAIKKLVLTGTAISVAALVGLGVISYFATARLINEQQWVVHTSEVLAALNRVSALLIEAESAQRGYLLTGDIRFLEHYNGALSQMDGTLERLDALVVDNPQQVRRLEDLNLLIKERVRVLNKRITIRRQEGLEAAAAAVATQEGEDAMDKALRAIAAIGHVENALLAAREDTTRTSAKRSLSIIIFGGAATCVFGLVALYIIERDLKAREQIEAERVRLFELSPDLMCVIHFDGRFKTLNPAWKRILAYSNEELLNKPLLEFAHPDDKSKMQKELDRLVQGEPSVEVEARYSHKNGGHRWLAWTARPDMEHRLIHASARDITDHKKIEQIHQHFRALFESLPGSYLVLTPDLKIVAVSDAYLKATMTSREKILSRDLFEMFPDNPDDPAATGAANLRASLDRVIRNSATDVMAIQKYDVRRPDGVFEERYWSPVNSPVLNADGKLEYIIHRVEDVTEFVKQKQQSSSNGHSGLEARLEQMEAEIFKSTQQVHSANQKLRSANEELEAFSYSVSHDLRAPLRHIAGFVDMLGRNASEKLDDKGKRYLGIIKDSTRQMGTLIDDLLVFSRMGRTELRWTRIDMNALVHEAISGMQPDLAGRNVKWTIGKLPIVQADPAMMRQVFVNLIGNAVKYTRPRDPAEIEIGYNEDNSDEYTFFVRDNGVGFDMQYAPKLFGVFQRLHRNDEFEGTGIGLANVRRIIYRHGGRTWAEGKIDAGATFYYTLPRQPVVAAT